MYKKLEGLNLEEINDHRKKSGKPEASKGLRLQQAQVEMHLADGMVENFHLKRRGKVLDFFVSVLGHGFVVVFLILMPLLYTHAINMPQFEKTLLVAPPPPPPPAAVHVIRRVPKSFFTQGKLFAPRFIPKKIEQVKEEPPAPPVLGAETGGVPGGVLGGQLGGVLGGILGGSRQFAPPPPKSVTHAGPYRVGGKVQAPRLIYQVQPIYPALAKQVRIQGDVVIDSVIDQQGKVTQMKVVSGSPLLVQSAVTALEQWRYQPTLLNGEPVPVDMFVTVHFQLGSQT